MPAPLVLIALPLLAGPALYLLRLRLPAAPPWRGLDLWLAAGLTALLAIFSAVVPVAEGGLFTPALSVVGRSFELSASGRLGASFTFAQAALIFALAPLTRPGRFFTAAGLAALGLLAAALFVQPFLFAALFVALAAALCVFMLADENRPSSRAPLRFLIFTSLGVPFILLTGWLLEGSAASPGDVAFTAQATAVLAIGFAAFLAVAPFHSWQPAVASDSPPLASAFVFSVMRLVPVFLLLAFMDTFDWLGHSVTVYRALTLAGGVQAGLGAVFAFGQRNFSRTIGYAVMIDTGAVLMAIGLGSSAGIQAALGTLALSGIAIPLWAAGLHSLSAGAGSDFDGLRGAAGRHPFAAAAVLLSLLSLAGFPMTAGFTGRWALLTLLAETHPTAALLLLFGTASVGVVCARGLAALLPPAGSAVSPSDSRAQIVAFSTGMLVLLSLGTFPQWLLPAVARAAGAFANLVK